MIELAYHKLKRMVYYEQANLWLRERLADFESNVLFESQLAKVKAVIDSEDPMHHPSFVDWLTQIDFHLVPKKLKDAISEKSPDNTFISNCTSAPKYNVESVNYFFDGPIELHLLAVYWVMTQGRMLDEMLTKDCYGSRLANSTEVQEFRSRTLFRQYHDQYRHWRDGAIAEAERLLTVEHRNVYVLGLDLQEYYYRIKVNYDDIADISVSSSVKNGRQLTQCIAAINKKYRKVIHDSLEITHPDIADDVERGIPIGICSSPILANWYLNKFDRDVREKLRPSYYGRYLDDILLVFQSEIVPGGNPVEDFLSRTLVNCNLLKRSDVNGSIDYELVGYPDLRLQQKKCILQYFNAEHAISGLVKFKKKLEENASNFRLLPVEEHDGALGDVAYDLLYEGSANKFRSVKGVAENRYELAKYLARQTILHQYTTDPPSARTVRDITRFFKGRNAIEFHDCWERVLTFFVIVKMRKEEAAFRTDMIAEIERLAWSGDSSRDIINFRMHRDMQSHLELSYQLGLCLARGDYHDGISLNRWRKSNLLRHHFVAHSLLNFTLSGSSYIDTDIDGSTSLDEHRLDWSPRVVHLEELMLFLQSGMNNACKTGRDEIFETQNNVRMPLSSISAFHCAKKFFKRINGFAADDVHFDEAKKDDPYNVNYVTFTVPEHSSDLHEHLRVALVNIPVVEKNVKASYRDKPILSRGRFSEITGLLNDIIRYNRIAENRCNLVVFPEVSIPWAWCQMLVGFARKEQIGLIFGVEHRIVKHSDHRQFALNNIMTVLPYTTRTGHRACLPIQRLKRYYSPEERHILHGNYLNTPDQDPTLYPMQPYHLFRWRGASFAVYNCFELTSIEDRSIFKGLVDFIECSEFNPDVNYFSSIVTSAARDLHCYVIQVNDSGYGDSRIVRPSKTEKLNIITIKGGENRTFLVATLDLKGLREHQRVDYSLQKESREFKPTPAGYKPELAVERIDYGDARKEDGPEKETD